MARKRGKTPRRPARQRRALQTVTFILDAAAQVLQREGYAAANTNRIAAVAGVSVGTIYQYFADKEQIFDAVIRRELDGVLGVLKRLTVDASESMTVGLKRLLELLVKARPDAPALYRSLEQVPNALFGRRVAEARGEVVAWIRTFLEAHRKEVTVRDLDVAAFILVAAAEGVAINASADLYRTGLADELATVFTRYLAR